ncbi:hypothetical protein [Winogradskyella thalassocola]|uniref:Uncharacterized protein n=1 Tax=Winogradskyella thalassocola TaxID=262004 RepID=A0A1G7YU08_9FLAO|nr:hypothetical protein [Winogradskyella thalassocola]SDG99867.1 hypothetical protein SAMN04489796_1011131 [Winogradskyella thalassocola]
MKIITLYSDVDFFIIAVITLITSMVLFNLVIRKLNSQKKVSSHLTEDEVEIELNHYMLNFNVIPVDQKQISFTSKCVVTVMAIAIVFIPFYEFVVKLTPELVYYGRSYILF